MAKKKEHCMCDEAHQYAGKMSMDGGPVPLGRWVVTGAGGRRVPAEGASRPRRDLRSESKVGKARGR